MPRKQRNNADYFPHFARLRNGKRVKALRNLWKNDGYAFFCIMLEVLTFEDFHRWEHTEINTELLAAEIGVSALVMNEMVDYSVKIGLFTRDGAMISSPELVTNLEPLYAKRVRNNPGYSVSAPDIPVKVQQQGISAPVIHQSKVKESKVKELPNGNNPALSPAPSSRKKVKITLELSDVGVKLNPRLASPAVCEAFYAFYEMRLNKPRKMPMTPRAAELVFMKLDKLAGPDDALAIALLEYATVKGYDTVFELPKEYSGQTSSGQHNRQQTVSDAYQVEEEKLKNRSNQK